VSMPSASDEKATAASLAAEIRAVVRRIGRPVKIMEVCGTHTVELRKQGVHWLLPPEIALVSGPGCPVCVTPIGYIDNALALAGAGKALIASFGDMLRVPGSSGASLASYSASGRVRMVYSPSELLEIARGENRPVVFLGIGFETTIPAILSAFKSALNEGIENLFLYSAFKIIPPALRLLSADPSRRIDGFLLPGHVSVIIGPEAYSFLEAPGGLPGVITGFDGLEMLLGILMLLRRIERGERGIENAYAHVVKPGGNPKAQALMKEMLAPADALWRGLGVMPGSGMVLRNGFSGIDAEKRFALPEIGGHDDPRCLCHKVITGESLPTDCPLFSARCTPDDPVGPCMVSSEGTCAAYLRYSGAGGGAG
jgi:hydrogenase expression/formation protein HypD